MKSKHQQELEFAREKLDSSNEAVRENIRKEFEEKQGKYERELKEKFIRDRNIEMQKLVSKLSDEAYETEQNLKTEYSQKAWELERKYKDEIDALKYSIENYWEQVEAEKWTKQMLDENLEIMTWRVSDIERQKQEKDQLIETLKNRILNQKREIDEISASIQMRNLELEEAQMDKVKEARHEAKQLRE